MKKAYEFKVPAELTASDRERIVAETPDDVNVIVVQGKGVGGRIRTSLVLVRERFLKQLENNGIEVPARLQSTEVFGVFFPVTSGWRGWYIAAFDVRRFVEIANEAKEALRAVKKAQRERKRVEVFYAA